MVSDGREGARKGRERTENTKGFAGLWARRVSVGKTRFPVPGSDSWETGSAGLKDGKR